MPLEALPGQEREHLPNRIIDEFSQIDIGPGWEVLSPGLHQCTNRKGAGYGSQCGSYHGKCRAGEPVATGVEMSIVVVNALWIHLAVPVFLCPLIFLFFVESLGILVDVVATVGHHLDGGVLGVFLPIKGVLKSTQHPQAWPVRRSVGD